MGGLWHSAKAKILRNILQAECVCIYLHACMHIEAEKSAVSHRRTKFWHIISIWVNDEASIDARASKLYYCAKLSFKFTGKPLLLWATPLTMLAEFPVLALWRYTSHLGAQMQAASKQAWGYVWQGDQQLQAWGWHGCGQQRGKVFSRTGPFQSSYKVSKAMKSSLLYVSECWNDPRILCQAK